MVCPLKYKPTKDSYLLLINQTWTRTQKRAGKVGECISYYRWYCGHYYTEKMVDKAQFLFKGIISLPTTNSPVK